MKQNDKKLNQGNVLRRIVLSMMCAMLSFAAFAQGGFSGTVVDESGLPIVGATVLVVGDDARGAITDVEGQFAIRAKAGEQLEVSSLGYVAQTVTLGAQTNIKVVLVEDTAMLDEVVVTAYGTTKKSSFTGSASVVKADALEKMNGGGFTDALQGMSAGVQVSAFAGNPGAEARIQIRGISSMSGTSNPLYIVDGMPYDGGLNSINPSDIESLTVLKDAAASSLYGSRAANGVIIITTKTGKAGKVTVNFRAAWGTSDNAVPYGKVADPKQTLLLHWESMYNDNYYHDGFSKADAAAKASAEVVEKLIKPTSAGTFVSPFDSTGIPKEEWVLWSEDKGAYINPALKYVWNPEDWDYYGTAYTRKLRQDYGIDVSGASDNGKTRYYVSGGYLNDGGYLFNQYYKRYTFRANVDSEINKWLTIGGSVAYTYYRQNVKGGNRVLAYNNSLSSPYYRNAENTDWVYSEKTGKRMWDQAYYTKAWFGYAPFHDALGDYWDNEDDYSFNSLDGHMVTARYYMDFKLPFGIKFKTSVNLDSNVGNSYTYGSAIHGGAQKAPWGLAVTSSGGDASRSSNETLSVTWNNVLNWDHTWGDHTLGVMLGHEMYTYTNFYQYGYGAGIMSQGKLELANTTRDWSAYSSSDAYALLSMFAKLDYNYANKYYLSGSFRRDGSSRFHPDSRWGNFFSVGASWRISQEGFAQDADWLDNAVLRASYGTSGNDKLIPRESNGKAGSEILYAYQGLYGPETLFGNAGLMPSTAPTPDLVWEKNKLFNVALDFTVIKDITATIEWYTRESEDLLYYRSKALSSTMGDVTGMNTNIGTLRNSGFEFTLGATALRARDFKWNIDFNLSTLKNEVVDLPSGNFWWANTVAQYRMEEGGSLYDIWAPHTVGVSKETGEMQYSYVKEDGTTGITTDRAFVAGDKKHWKKVGSSLPKVYGSLTNTFLYKGFDLSFMFYYSLGSVLYDYQYNEKGRLSGSLSPYIDVFENRWQNPGDDADFPRLSKSYWGEHMGYNDFYVYKNNYLRLRNLTFGYTVPAKLTKKIGVQKLRVYFSGDNLFTVGNAAKHFVDPEQAGVSGNNYNGNSETDNGIQGARRIYMGGIQLTF